MQHNASPVHHTCRSCAAVHCWLALCRNMLTPGSGISCSVMPALWTNMPWAAICWPGAIIWRPPCNNKVPLCSNMLGLRSTAICWPCATICWACAVICEPRANQTLNQTSTRSLVFRCAPAAFDSFPFGLPFTGRFGKRREFAQGGPAIMLHRASIRLHGACNYAQQGQHLAA